MKIEFSDTEMLVVLGERAVIVALTPRLLRATPEQRNKYELSASGIHWPEIDEDLSFRGLFNKND